MNLAYWQNCEADEIKMTSFIKQYLNILNKQRLTVTTRNKSNMYLFQLRFLRHTISDHERGAHQSQANLPGAFTAKGFPNTLIQVCVYVCVYIWNEKDEHLLYCVSFFQADRSRRHLNSNKKRPLPPRSRVGSYSLLSHIPLSPLPVRIYGNVHYKITKKITKLQTLKCLSTKHEQKSKT